MSKLNKLQIKKVIKGEKTMKRKLPKTENWMKREMLRQRKRFEDTCSQFYSDGTIVDFSFPAVDDETYDFLYESREIFTDEDQERRKRIENKILRVCHNVLEGKTGNVEICFDEGMIYSGSDKYEMGNTIAMIRIGSECQYVFLKEGDRFDAKIFMENGTQNAFLVLKDKVKDKDGNEETVIIFLDEFYLLGICYEGEVAKENTKKTAKNMGIMIGYEWVSENLYCDPAEEIMFSKIKELLAADWLQEKWKKTKEANGK